MKHILFIAAATAALSCNSSSNPEVSADELAKNFYPIEGNIKAELKEIDSLPIAVIRYTTVGEKTDTSIVEKAELRKLAEMMYRPDIALPELKKYYKESVLFDKTSGLLTMSYTTEAKDPEVRKLEVTLNPETEKLKSIYVEKLQNGGDSSRVQRMIWTPGKNFQVISITNKAGQPEKVSTDKYHWGL